MTCLPASSAHRTWDAAGSPSIGFVKVASTTMSPHLRFLSGYRYAHWWAPRCLELSASTRLSLPRGDRSRRFADEQRGRVEVVPSHTQLPTASPDRPRPGDGDREVGLSSAYAGNTPTNYRINDTDKPGLH